MNKVIMMVSIIGIFVDQICKIVLSIFLSLNNSITIIKNFFYLTYRHNYGAAWSLFSGGNIFLIIVGVIGFYVIINFIKSFKLNFRNNIAFGLLIGGLLGNLIDRVFLGYVRDFFDFKIFNYNFPVFNIADIMIVISSILLIYAIIKGEDNNVKNKS